MLFASKQTAPTQPPTINVRVGLPTKRAVACTAYRTSQETPHPMAQVYAQCRIGTLTKKHAFRAHAHFCKPPYGIQPNAFFDA